MKANSAIIFRHLPLICKSLYVLLKENILFAGFLDLPDLFATEYFVLC